VLRDAIGAGWKEWGSWKSGASSPTMARVDRLHEFMRANPAPEPQGASQEDAA